MKETPERRRQRLGLQEATMKLGRTIGDVVKSECGPGVGFALVMFDFGEDGSMAYCSNGVRRDMIQMLDELFLCRECGLRGHGELRVCDDCDAPAVDTCPSCQKDVCSTCAEREGAFCCDGEGNP